MSTATESKSKKLNIEIITPHKLTIGILIRDYCQYRKKARYNLDGDRILKPKCKRDFCVLILKLLQSPDLSLQELRNILVSKKYEVLPNVIDTFDESLTNLYENGSGALLDTIESLNGKMGISELLPSRVENTCFVSKSSVVGYFLRRLIVNFEILTFSEATNVYLAFRSYYEEWQKSVNSENGADTPELCTDDWSANREQWSRRQADLFIATQAELLTNNEEKALPPQDLQNRISDLLKSNPSLSEAHYLSYLNYLRVKEFCLAIDSLYHCFDRSSLSDSKNTSEDKNKIYRYASLNLAVLHYHFGHKEEALASLKESIRISQAANDDVCLQHALCWLYRLTPVNKGKLIEHSVLKGFELNLSYTTSLGIQTFVQHACLISGLPYLIFETLTKGDLVNSQHNLRDLISNSYAVKAALWQFYGKSEMSLLWSQLLFYLNINNSKDNKAFYCEGFCLAACNIANQLLMQGSYGLVHTIINFAKERFPNEPYSHIWMLCENLFHFVRALHHENWIDAESAANKIFVFNKWEGYLRLAELFYYMENYSEAHRYVDILMTKYQSNSKYELKTFYYIRAKILLAEIQFSSSFPDRVSPGIMTLLNKCLIETAKYNLDYYSAVVHIHLANLQLSLGMVGHALRTLDKSLVQILTHGGCFDRARAVLLYVKCMVAQSNGLDEAERKSVIVEATDMLEQVKENFREVEAFSRVKDVLYFQAHLYNTIDMRTERNKCAYEFRLLEEEISTKNFHTLVKFL